MTPNPYAPFRLWQGAPIPERTEPPIMWLMKVDEIIDHSGERSAAFWQGVATVIQYVMKERPGDHFVLTLRDPSRCAPLFDAFRDDPRVILALVVERQGDLERLVPGINGLYITPVESLHTDDQSLGLFGTRPDSWGMDYGPVADMIRLVIAHGQIGVQVCPKCRGQCGDCYVKPCCKTCWNQGVMSPAPCSPSWLSAIVAECQAAGVPCCVPDAGAGGWVEVTHPEIYDWSDTPYDRHTLDGRLFVMSGAAWNPRCEWPRELPEGFQNA